MLVSPSSQNLSDKFRGTLLLKFSSAQKRLTRLEDVTVSLYEISGLTRMIDGIFLLSDACADESIDKMNIYKKSETYNLSIWNGSR
jgi:hypothetical protein